MSSPVSCLLPFPLCRGMEVYGNSYTLHQVLFPQNLQNLSIYKGPVQEADTSNHQITDCQDGQEPFSFPAPACFLGEGVPPAGSPDLPSWAWACSSCHPFRLPNPFFPIHKEDPARGAPWPRLLCGLSNNACPAYHGQ